jgi:replicative DNA helicase
MISAPASEKAVLGSWLIEKEAISACVDIIGPEHFYDQFNASVCRIILDAYKAGKAVDVVSVNLGLQEAGLASNQSLTALAELCHSVTTAAHASHHAKTVLDRYLTRQVIAAAKAITDRAETESLTEAEVKALSELVMRKEAVYAPTAFTYKNSLVDFRDRMDSRATKALYRTGIKVLDAAYYGVSAGEVVTVALATNVGKSVTCLNIMHNMASRDIPCGYIGTEMSSDETAQRHLSIVSGVAAHKLRIGRLETTDIGPLNHALSEKMAKMPIAILDHPNPSLADINSFIIANDCKVVFIDYLERCEMPKAESYRLKIREFMAGLKTLARRRGVVVFLASQLGRQTYSSTATKPTLADLSESKAIEQESDKVLLGYMDQMKQKGDGDTILSFINAKNRAGKKGQEFDLLLDGRTLALREMGNEISAQFKAG